MISGERYIFLSYATEDESYAQTVHRYIAARQSSLLVETCAVLDGFDEDWRTAAAEKISLCHALVCLVGPSTYLSEPVNWEIGFAFNEGKEVLAIATTNELIELPKALKDRSIHVLASNSHDHLFALAQVGS